MALEHAWIFEINQSEFKSENSAIWIHSVQPSKCNTQDIIKNFVPKNCNAWSGFLSRKWYFLIPSTCVSQCSITWCNYLQRINCCITFGRHLLWTVKSERRRYKPSWQISSWERKPRSNPEQYSNLKRQIVIQYKNSHVDACIWLFLCRLAWCLKGLTCHIFLHLTIKCQPFVIHVSQVDLKSLKFHWSVGSRKKVSWIDFKIAMQILQTQEYDLW